MQTAFSIQKKVQPAAGRIKILVVDSRSIISQGISLILGGYADFEVTGQAGSMAEALQMTDLFSPNVVCMDIDLAGPAEGLELIRRLGVISPSSRVVVLTNRLESMIVHQALREGVLGYLLKDASMDELAGAIRTAHAGIPALSPEVVQILVRNVTQADEPDLTHREHQVLDLVARGLNNQEIARELNICLSTVQFHVSHILQKLAVHNRIEAAAFAIRHNLASSPGD